jgi:hypothetical protein
MSAQLAAVERMTVAQGGGSGDGKKPAAAAAPRPKGATVETVIAARLEHGQAYATSGWSGVRCRALPWCHVVGCGVV